MTRHAEGGCAGKTPRNRILETGSLAATTAVPTNSGSTEIVGPVGKHLSCKIEGRQLMAFQRGGFIGRQRHQEVVLDAVDRRAIPSGLYTLNQ